MSHDANGFCLVQYMISTWLVPEVQALGIESPIVRPALTFLSVVRPSTPQKTDYEL